MRTDLRRWMTLCEAIADQHEIAAIIMQELSGGGWRWPAECNDGYCGQFADRVVHKLGQGRVTSTDEIPIEHEGGRHEWIVVNGRHYDSETPYGVDDPRNLGYFAVLCSKRHHAKAAVEAGKFYHAAWPNPIPCPT